MPRGNPKISEYGESTRFGSERGCNAAEAGEKGNETRRLLKSFREIDAEDPDTPKDRKEMLAFLKRMAKRNLHAFEIYRDTVGLKPTENIEISGTVNNPFEGLTTEELRRLIDG